jgi:hypothetical protein
LQKKGQPEARTEGGDSEEGKGEEKEGERDQEVLEREDEPA